MDLVRLTVYPRVGGATVEGALSLSLVEGLSPRGRGNLKFRYVDIAGGRSIPAWAGQPVRVGVLPQGPEVYPRVGGATHGALGGIVGK